MENVLGPTLKARISLWPLTVSLWPLPWSVKVNSFNCSWIWLYIVRLKICSKLLIYCNDKSPNDQQSYLQKLPPCTYSPIAIILLSHPYGLKDAQNPLPYHQYTSRVILRAYNSDINLIPTNDFSQNILLCG